MSQPKKKNRSRRLNWRNIAALAVLFAVAIGVALYLSWPNSPSAPKFNNSSALPTVKWLSYTVPGSSLSFNYPANWKLVAGQSPLGPYASARTPQTSLVAPDGLFMNILTDNDQTANSSTGSVLAAKAVSALGGNYYLDYINDSGGNSFSYFGLYSGPAINSPYPSIDMPGGGQNRLIVSVSYQASAKGPVAKTLASVLADPYAQQAVSIIRSMTN